MSPRHVIVLRLSALGDVAMTLPVIYCAARQYPDVRFTVVTRPFFRRLFIDPPANIEFHDFDAKGRHKGTRGLLRLARELRAMKPDAVADLHDVLRTMVLRTAIPGKIAMVEKNRLHRRELTRGKSREWQPNYVERYAEVFARLGMPVRLDFNGLFPPTERCGIGVAPFARYQTKTYPPELMEQVCRLLTDAGQTVYLYGARGDEEEQLHAWAIRNPALKVVAGTMTLEEELESMSRLQLMVSMDSANMHLASLAGTRVISLWGSTIPQCGFLGYGQSPDDAIWLDLPCQPCSIAGLPACPNGNLACLRRMPPRMIADKVLAAL